VVGLRPADPEPLAVLAEQRADVGREVGEEVARILVLGDPPARQLRLEAVDAAAAVRVDQPAQEGPRERVHDRALPVGEHDRPLVLAPRARLRKEVQPAAVIRRDADAALPADVVHAHADSGQHGAGGRHTCGDDRGIIGIEPEHELRS
jgi:hypothetical protein